MLLSFIVPILAWNVSLISPVFLKSSLVFLILLFSSTSLHYMLYTAANPQFWKYEKSISGIIFKKANQEGGDFHMRGWLSGKAPARGPVPRFEWCLWASSACLPPGFTSFLCLFCRSSTPLPPCPSFPHPQLPPSLQNAGHFLSSRHILNF